MSPTHVSRIRLFHLMISIRECCAAWSVIQAATASSSAPVATKDRNDSALMPANSKKNGQAGNQNDTHQECQQWQRGTYRARERRGRSQPAFRAGCAEIHG